VGRAAQALCRVLAIAVGLQWRRRLLLLLTARLCCVHDSAASTSSAHFQALLVLLIPSLVALPFLPFSALPPLLLRDSAWRESRRVKASVLRLGGVGRA
jgi:hypothetical protein